MQFIEIRVVNHSAQTQIGTVDLPSFCVDHMRMTPPEMNLATMIKHIKSRCGGLAINQVFMNGKEITGLTADEIKNTMTIEIE